MHMTRIRKISILCLLPVLVCLLTTVAEAAAAQPETVYTSLIYCAPSSQSRIAGRMEDGTKVRILDQQGSYYKIDCYDTDGYIAASQVKEDDGAYYVCCDPESYHTVQMQTQSIPDALRLRTAILTLGKLQLGDPYVYGATGPNAFDCSGFTSYLYKHNGYTPARICSGQMAQGVIVSRQGLQVGDLIFFGSSLGSVSHVGIYAGDGQILHAGSRGICYADLDSAWFARNYLCARRIITVGSRITQLTPPAAADAVMSRSVTTAIRSAG